MIPPKEQVLAKEVGAKFSTKLEVFKFLAYDVRAHLPEYGLVTIYFLKDIISGEKKCKSK